MKKLFAIILVLMTVTVCAQERGDNTIVVTTDYEYSEAYRRAGQALASNGMTIDHADKDIGTISSRPKYIATTSNPDRTVRVSVIVDEGIISIQGIVENHGIADPQLTYGGRLSALRSAWEELHKVAEHIGGEISYEQR